MIKLGNVSLVPGSSGEDLHPAKANNTIASNNSALREIMFDFRIVHFDFRDRRNSCGRACGPCRDNPSENVSCKAVGKKVEKETLFTADMGHCTELVQYADKIKGGEAPDLIDVQSGFDANWITLMAAGHLSGNAGPDKKDASVL